MDLLWKNKRNEKKRQRLKHYYDTVRKHERKKKKNLVSIYLYIYICIPNIINKWIKYAVGWCKIKQQQWKTKRTSDEELINNHVSSHPAEPTAKNYKLWQSRSADKRRFSLVVRFGWRMWIWHSQHQSSRQTGGRTQFSSQSHWGPDRRELMTARYYTGCQGVRKIL